MEAGAAAMSGMIQQAMEHVPRWLMPSVVVAVIALALWNQNNERRFVLLESQAARNEERITNTVSLIERIEQALITNFAQTRAEDRAHVEQTRALVIKDFEDRIARVNARLDRIEQHLEAIDEKVDAIRETWPRR